MNSTGIKAWKRNRTWNERKEAFGRSLSVLASQGKITGKDRQVNRKGREGEAILKRRINLTS